MRHRFMIHGLYALASAGCSTQSYTIENPCDYTVGSTIAADDPGELGFTAEQVLAAASVSSTGQTTSDDVAESWTVSMTHTFTREGEASVIDFGSPSDARCPVGRALMVPASYEIAGTIGEWPVRSARGGHAVVATALALDAMSFTHPSVSNPGLWDAEVDAHLRAIALSAAIPEGQQSTCAMIFSLNPVPDNLFAGAWADELSQGGLDVGCDQTYTGMFLTWTPIVAE